jgi:hypothetical protein
VSSFSPAVYNDAVRTEIERMADALLAGANGAVKRATII